MRCHYEVLAVERDVGAKEVKKAFHVQALRWHPDKHQKNNISSDEATLRFQEIQSAYEVLSDAHERKWYDDHREQILRGDDGNGGNGGDDDDEGGDGLNLFRYFSPSVYSGFGKDEKSFYSVYDALFTKVPVVYDTSAVLKQADTNCWGVVMQIDEMDIATVATASNIPHEAPVFGDKRSSMDDVNAFYQHWSSYISQRTFAWVDEYRTLDAPSRQVRRAMEKENKKLRDAAKKAFTTEVRELVDFVRRRDQRMIAFLKQREKEKTQQRRDEEAKKKAKQAAYEAEKLAFQQQEHKRWESMESHETSRLAQNDIDEELERMRRKMDADLLLCDLCRKTFKSSKQLQNHLVSKKHRDMEVELGIGIGSDYNSLEAELEAEMLAELAVARKNGTVKPKSLDGNDDEAGAGAGAGQGTADQEEDAETAERREQEAEAARVAEDVRLLKEHKAAEKRKERKEQRKQQKKEGVEKLTSGNGNGNGSGGAKNAKDKDNGKSTKNEAKADDFSDSEEEGGKRGSRRKGTKGKKR